MSWNSNDFRNYRAQTPALGFSSRVLSQGSNPEFRGTGDAFSGVLSDGGSFADSGYASLSNFGLGGSGAPSARGQAFDRSRAAGMAGFGREGAFGDKTNLTPELGGWEKAGIGMQGLSALTNAFMGMKQYGLAKKQFDFQKGAYEANYANQRSEVNRELEERQTRRVAENPDRAVSVADYVARYGIR